MFPSLPAGFKYWWRGSCVPAAIVLMDELVEGRDYVLQGMVRFARRDVGACWHQHTWMEIGGRIYDPTLVQFRGLRTFHGNPVRNVIVRFGAEHWRQQVACVDHLFWINRVREFGGRVSLRDLQGLVFHSHPEEAEDACA